MKKSEQTFRKKKKERWSEQNKKSTFRAFASRANKPFAGKFARDWKKSLKIVSLEKNLANEASDFGSILKNNWKKSLKIVSLEKNFANKDSDFGSMFLELLFEPGKFATDWNKINENSLIRHQNWKYDLIWGYLTKLEERFRKGRWSEQNKKSTFRAFASRANKPFAGKFAEKSLKIVSL